MNRYKIITVVGARPQFVKAAALSEAIHKSDRLSEVIVHSGQHYDDSLSANFFEELNIPHPKYNLAIGSVSHNVFIAEFLRKFDKVLIDEKPDMVIVYGDTNTTAAAAIATAKRSIKLSHVEAGLREWDKTIPEEINKLLTDSVSDLLFTPTATGVDNLLKEGKSRYVYMTGDISLDLLAKEDKYLNLISLKDKLGLDDRFIFMTCHREANTTKDNLAKILKGVSQLGHQVLWPIHPRTKAAIKKYQLGELVGDNIIRIEPIGYWETQTLLRASIQAITDSGGIIKEAYFHKVPSIVIDKQTEWLEAVKEGWTHIAGPDTDAIIELSRTITVPQNHFNSLGDGSCGNLIVHSIIEYLDAKR